MKYSSLMEWWELKLPLVDLREAPTQHALRSTSSRVVVQLAFSSLRSGARSCELPPRHVQFGILIDSNCFGDSPEVDDILSFFFASSSKATQQSRKPWRVAVVLVACSKLWEQARNLGIYLNEVSEGQSARSVTFQPMPRLWEPDPILPTLLWPLLKQRLLQGWTKDDTFEIWDLGSGAGRDVCYLSEQIKSLGPPLGYVTVVGLDNHKASAKRCLPFWTSRNVHDIARAESMDLSKISQMNQELTQKRVVCLYSVRYWNRKLVAYIAHEGANLLEPGTIFAMSHFCKAYKGADWEFDHPKVRKKALCAET
jgi:hypothetical protein